ncbi:hypothetical protein DENSPDRAFT_914313 [Dentipellis sp. KUC8613]|nr:hypothetical protein DENSPDRAFT_914313 [Dentipellis sp. KUC8613]
MYSSNRANHRQPYRWAGAPGQVSGSSSHAAAPPATAYDKHNATLSGYHNDGSPAAYAGTHPYNMNYQHGTSFQTPGNSTLHPSYDPHPDQFTAALESAFPHLHAPQTSSTASTAERSAYPGYTPANLGTNFPHSSYSELANYAGDYRPADNAPGAAQAAVVPGKFAAPSSMHHDHTNERRTSIAEPSARGQKRKSRKGATAAPVTPQGEPLGDESNEERARKNKKARQQRDYRARDKGIVDELEGILPDGYKTNDPRAIRKKVARGVEYIKDLTEKNFRLEVELEKHKVLLRSTLEERRSWQNKYSLSQKENDELRETIQTFQNTVRYPASDWN